MKSNLLPRNQNLPQGISLLRQLNAKANSDTLNLGLGKPELDMPLEIRKIAEKCIHHSQLEYTENAGDLGVRKLLAKKLKIENAKELILTHGAQEALTAALVAILNNGDEVLIPNPGFLAYETQVKMLGGKAVYYPIPFRNHSYQHDLNEIKKRITTRTKAIIISSPGNPTGCDFTKDELKALLKLTESKKIVILSDEVYGMLHFKIKYSPLSNIHERIISIHSFSKSHALTGWRIGFLSCMNQELYQACLVAHQYITTCASVPSQRLLGALLESASFDRISKDYRKEYQNKLKLFVKHSSSELKAKTPKACGGFYLFPSLPKNRLDFEFCETLLAKENLLAIPGSIFGSLGRNSIRLSLALPDQKIIQAAKILSSYY